MVQPKEQVLARSESHCKQRAPVVRRHSPRSPPLRHYVELTKDARVRTCWCHRQGWCSGKRRWPRMSTGPFSVLAAKSGPSSGGCQRTVDRPPSRPRGSEFCRLRPRISAIPSCWVGGCQVSRRWAAMDVVSRGTQEGGLIWRPEDGRGYLVNCSRVRRPPASSQTGRICPER